MKADPQTTLAHPVPFREHEAELKRELHTRHVGMIAIGSCLGMGLFLASGSAISRAGPSLLLAYLVASVGVYLVLRALGELLLHRPAPDSFARCVEEFLGSHVGFVTGWAYWLLNVIVAIAQVTAAGILVNYWYPAIPHWSTALVALCTLYGINLLAVRSFGEFAFWLSAVKLLTVLGLVLVGLFVLLRHRGAGAGFANLWIHGGFFPHGATGTLFALPVAVLAFVGAETIGMTAAETDNPSVVIPKAVKRTMWQLSVCYVGSLLVIMALVQWDTMDTHISPFVLTFDRIGVPAAGGIVNIVILSAILSACSSEIYSTGRMLYMLARSGHAPGYLGRVNDRGVPIPGLTGSFIALLAGVVLNYLLPRHAFDYLVALGSGMALWVWGVIVVAHLRYRRTSAVGASGGPIWARGRPFTDWLLLAFLLSVFGLMAFSPTDRCALLVPAVLLLLAFAGWLTKRPALLTGLASRCGTAGRALNRRGSRRVARPALVAVGMAGACLGVLVPSGWLDDGHSSSRAGSSVVAAARPVPAAVDGGPSGSSLQRVPAPRRDLGSAESIRPADGGIRQVTGPASSAGPPVGFARAAHDDSITKSLSTPEPRHPPLPAKPSDLPTALISASPPPPAPLTAAGNWHPDGTSALVHGEGQAPVIGSPPAGAPSPPRSPKPEPGQPIETPAGGVGSPVQPRPPEPSDRPTLDVRSRATAPLGDQGARPAASRPDRSASGRVHDRRGRVGHPRHPSRTTAWPAQPR